MKRKNSVRNVQHSVLPPLTEEQKAQIASLRVMPEGEIDYGDAPALSDEQWGTAL